MSPGGKTSTTKLNFTMIQINLMIMVVVFLAFVVIRRDHFRNFTASSFCYCESGHPKLQTKGPKCHFRISNLEEDFHNTITRGRLPHLGTPPPIRALFPATHLHLYFACLPLSLRYTNRLQRGSSCSSSSPFFCFSFSAVTEKGRHLLT